MRLTLLILSYERPSDVVACIGSALAQTDVDFDLIVSDNSVTDSAYLAIRRTHPQVKVIRRQPSLPALDHFNRCLEEVQTSHFCLFHDDDLLLPDFVREVKLAWQAAPESAAMAPNAIIERDGVRQARPSFLCAGHSETIASSVELARKYFSRHQNGIAPFPGYVYSRNHVARLRFDPNAGKYSDVAWLLQVCHAGSIQWLRTPLMVYRLHGHNDGLSESRRDRLRLLRFFKTHPHLLDSAALTDYRAFVHKKHPPRTHPSPTSMRERIVGRFLRAHRITRHFRWSAIRALLAHTWIKWKHR